MRANLLSVSMAAVAALSCGSSGGTPTAPSAPLTSSTETVHYVFHYAATDSVDAVRQEAFHDWFTPMFGVSLDQRIQYYKYASRTEITSATGQNTNGFAVPSTATLHTIWPFEPHEAIHVYSATFGEPSDFFNEGIAVGLSTDPMAGRLTPWWNARPVDDVVRGLQQQGQVPALSTIAETLRFRALDSQISYPVAGSFMAFVVATHGVVPTKSFFRTSSRQDPLATIRANFQLVFGVSFESAEQAWIEHLR
jgi:hypothetical protein